MITIIGAGPAGLSCAYHLKSLGAEFQVFEKESRPGGLVRTEKFGDYMFDYGGHLLHFRNPDIERWLKGLVGENNLTRFKRKSFVFSNKVLTPYPFQVNTYGLPAEVIRDCLLGFIDAKFLTRHPKIENFRDWILYHFGHGFAHHFFFPFNKKFWRVPLTELEPEWAEWSIPRPTLKDVVDGALGINVQDFGYNIFFYYPKNHGIEAVSQAISKELGKIFLNREIISLNLKNRKILLDNGEEMEYTTLVSTIPLKMLINKINDAPEDIKKAGEGLRYISVICVNLGINGPEFFSGHWIYFPEEQFIFYRAGFYSNFLEHPGEKRSIVLEITYSPNEEQLKDEEYIKKAVADFKNTGLLTDAHKIEYTGVMRIPCAYVIYDRHRKNVLPGLTKFLEENGIYSIGRYGRWGYSTIEDSLRDGRELARRLISK